MGDETAKLAPQAIPPDLPAHPEEDKLLSSQRDLADVLRKATRKACRALETRGQRVDAAVALAQLAAVAATGQRAMVKAIQDQMDLVPKAG